MYLYLTRFLMGIDELNLRRRGADRPDAAPSPLAAAETAVLQQVRRHHPWDARRGESTPFFDYARLINCPHFIQLQNSCSATPRCSSAWSGAYGGGALVPSANRFFLQRICRYSSDAQPVDVAAGAAGRRLCAGLSLLAARVSETVDMGGGISRFCHTDVQRAFYSGAVRWGYALPRT